MPEIRGASSRIEPGGSDADAPTTRCRPGDPRNRLIRRAECRFAPTTRRASTGCPQRCSRSGYSERLPREGDASRRANDRALGESNRPANRRRPHSRSSNRPPGPSRQNGFRRTRNKPKAPWRQRGPVQHEEAGGRRNDSARECSQGVTSPIIGRPPSPSRENATALPLQVA